jgi:hypothetical protein
LTQLKQVYYKKLLAKVLNTITTEEKYKPVIIELTLKMPSTELDLGLGYKKVFVH